MKVLLIDDNQEICEAVAFYLESQGIECKVLNEGRKGLESIRNNNEKYIPNYCVPDLPFSRY